MKKYICIAFLGFLALSQVAFAQSDKDPVVFEFAGEKITKSQLLKSFNQANANISDNKNACTYEKRKALEDYAELYLRFRLKLHDAYANKYDTSASLKNEYKIYRNEMAMPYLIDSVALENLLQRTYQRNQYAVRASHIMVKVKKNASPEDTLKAYNKAMEIYDKVMAGEDFAELAVALSDDESARPYFADNSDQKFEGNKGDIGYFTIFEMVPDFEDAVYDMKVGEVSKPVRSQFGYHIIKKTGCEKVYGKVSLQQIWVRNNDNIPGLGEQRINDAYQKLQEGADFSEMVKKYSAGVDRNDSIPGLVAEMPSQRMFVGYVPEIAKLKIGEYSKPFQTAFGWHIIKILTKEEIPSYADMQEFYKNRISASQYGSIPQTKFIEKCKKDYKYVDFTTHNSKLIKDVVEITNDSIFLGKWTYTGKLNEKLFTINGKIYTQHDFAKYLETTQIYERIYDRNVYVSGKYKSFVNKKILEQADSLLEINNKDFCNQMQEFRDGLVIFAYNDANVWTKASTDTAGLRDFYQRECQKHNINNPEEAMYFWDVRARSIDIFINDSACLKPSKAIKLVKKMAMKEGKTADEIRTALLEQLSKKCTIENPVGAASRIAETKGQRAPGGKEWKKGVFVMGRTHGYRITCITEIRDPELKSLAAAKGYYTNDYQNELETKLNNDLKEKYKPVVHQDVIESILNSMD